MGTKKHDGDKHAGPGRSSPYGISRLAPAIELVDVAREIETADRLVGSVVGGKLEILAKQIRALQEQAREILDDARRDLDLHRARCNFQRRPGQTYHLYRKANGELYFSMLSPVEWGEPPHEFVGSYRLEADLSWTPAEEIPAREAEHAALRKMLHAGDPGE